MSGAIAVRQTEPADFAAIEELSQAVYPSVPPWTEPYLAAHRRVFPEGQLVALVDDRIVGMASSLIVAWDDYDVDMHWRDFTDDGWFTNHDPKGRTLYGAEIMVHPAVQRLGAGRALYAARRALVQDRRLLRIRAGARLRGYHAYADQMSAERYTIEVIGGRIKDPTLTFQLRQGFEVLAVVSQYLRQDPESLGYAAVIEWLNEEVAVPADAAGRNPKFRRPPP